MPSVVLVNILDPSPCIMNINCKHMVKKGSNRDPRSIPKERTPIPNSKVIPFTKDVLRLRDSIPNRRAISRVAIQKILIFKNNVFYSLVSKHISIN